MDDREFDEYIKRKISNFEEPGFDPDALSMLHQRMSAVREWRWYTRYRTELIICSSVLLATLIILSNQWYTRHHFAQITSNEKKLFESQGKQIAKLEEEIKYLKRVHTDTIRIVEIRVEPSTEYSNLLRKITALEKVITALNERNSTTQNAGIAYEHSSFINPSISGEAIDSDEIDFIKDDKRLVPRGVDEKSLKAESIKGIEHSAESTVELSSKKIRELEKHYRNGIGIQLGPTLELSKGIYSAGKGEPAITAGILADLVFSSSLSLETGVKYVHRFYEISGEESLSEVELPGVDTSLGTLINADVDSWIMEVPLNLKYRYPISMKTHWLAGIGYSSLLYTKQIFEYDHEFEDGSPITINSAYEKSGIEVYPGTLNVSLGLSRQLKNKKTLETSLYYQHGLGKAGLENSNVDFFGVRGVYWFTIR